MRRSGTPYDRMVGGRVAGCGTRTGYTNGCRCDRCRAANTRYQRKWRSRNPGITAKYR